MVPFQQIGNRCLLMASYGMAHAVRHAPWVGSRTQRLCASDRSVLFLGSVGLPAGDYGLRDEVGENNAPFPARVKPVSGEQFPPLACF